MLTISHVTIVVALMSFAISAKSQVLDPIPGNVPFGPITIELTEFAQIPQSSGGGAGIARINHLKPDGSGRLFVNDLRGRMYLVAEGTADLYLDLKNEVGSDFRDSSGLGTGFTSFAFHPDFSTNGLFYTSHSEIAGSAVPDFPVSGSVSLQGVILEWTATSPSSDAWAGSRREIMRVDLPGTIHGMQEISFNTAAGVSSADYGMLYICIGDGQSTIFGRPELTHRLDGVLGTILRIDPLGTNSVNGQYGIPIDNPWASDGDATTFGEIYAYGFRNPHRISWDADDETVMFEGEIGEKSIEEVNLIEAGNDYGWNVREGTWVINSDFANNPSAGEGDEVFELPENDGTLGFTYPVAQYDHGEGIACIGGYVYRGSALGAIKGQYIFGDLVNGGQLYHFGSESVVQGVQSEIQRIRIRFNGRTYSTMKDVTSVGSGNRDSDLRFGYDESNELYVLSKHNGKVYKVTGAADSSDPNIGVGVKFVNIATRGLVGENAGEELIGGFVLLGDDPQEVLIRGLGPDLTDRGVEGALADPVIEVRNFAGELIATGDDWSDEANADDIEAAIASLSGDPSSALVSGSKDAAILITLSPNDVYTVVVSGKGSAGVALIEVFEND